MIRFSTVARGLAIASLSFLMAGCLPSSQGTIDEQKDPHYLSGRARVSSLDYKGAVEEFEKALEGNPRSASAHLELGLLYEEHMQDYAAAIYHYEQHLKLRPNSEYVERAKDRIRACKSELVKTEYVAPVTQGMQREMEKLLSENLLLKQRVESLEAQLASRPTQVVAAPQNPRTAPATFVTPQNPAPESARISTASNPRPAPEPAPARRRTYTVKSGDKLTTIARQNGVDLDKLLKVNPGVNPARLQIGQTLNLP